MHTRGKFGTLKCENQHSVPKALRIVLIGLLSGYFGETFKLKFDI